MEKDREVIFDKNTIEFVTVAAEYCAFMERAREKRRDEWVDTALKLLPLLYLKASLIPPCERLGIDEPAQSVSEADYEYVRMAVKAVMGSQDDYLEVFVPDMIYSEGPLTCTISEDLADIYQDVRNFIEVFQCGINLIMNDTLAVCKEHFSTYWGQRLVNAMRALHDAKYNQCEEGESRDAQADYPENETGL